MSLPHMNHLSATSLPLMCHLHVTVTTLLPVPATSLHLINHLIARPVDQMNNVPAESRRKHFLTA